jgi:hypothetical protein
MGSAGMGEFYRIADCAAWQVSDRRLPFDTLKIDRSFINELSTGNDGLDIVKAILEMAHSLRLEVIAEGVETAEQVGQLRGLGCKYVQGFLFSKPVKAEDAERMYAKESVADIPIARLDTQPVIGSNGQVIDIGGLTRELLSASTN